MSGNPELQKAKKKALALLTDRDRSTAELRNKLAGGGFSTEIIDEAIAYVQSFGYLDDERFTDHYIEFYRQSRSRQRIRMELINKGVDKAGIDRAFDRLEPYDEKPLIYELAQKKIRSLHGDEETCKIKVIQSLARKGFSVGDIRSVLDDMESLT